MKNNAISNMKFRFEDQLNTPKLIPLKVKKKLIFT